MLPILSGSSQPSVKFDKSKGGAMIIRDEDVITVYE
jgi:hypothetical protein